jgi:hypothetical protein
VKIGNSVALKNDPVVKILETCKFLNHSKKNNKETLTKLMERINMDRPIM